MYLNCPHQSLFLKLDFYIFFVLFYLFVIANFKNVYLYYVYNLLIMLFCFGITTTKYPGIILAFSIAGISYARSIISFYTLFVYISVQSLLSSQQLYNIPLSSILDFCFKLVQLMIVSIFIDYEKAINSQKRILEFIVNIKTCLLVSKNIHINISFSFIFLLDNLGTLPQYQCLIFIPR